MEKERIKCPYCSEPIFADARKCRFCGEWFTEKNKPAVNSGLAAPHAPEALQEPQAEPELEEAVKEPHEELVESPGEKSKTKPPQKKHRIAWLRIILVIIYLGIIVGFVIYERNAHEVLHSGQELENNQQHQAALEKYKEVIEGFRFSFAVIEARKGLRRVEDQLGNKFSTDNVYWLPFIAWPICAVLLFLVFSTRILRLGIASLAFLLLVIAICGSVLQLAWYGLISFEPIAKVVPELMAKPVAIFIVSYALLIVTAMMTLTSPGKIALGHRVVPDETKEL